MVLFIAVTCLSSSCHKDNDNPTKGDKEEYEDYDPSMAESRTILLYMAAENSLSKNEGPLTYVEADLNEVLYGMSHSRLKRKNNLVIFVDDTKLPRIYHISPSDTTLHISKVKAELSYSEDVNSASVTEIEKAVDYMLKHYPAESYGIVFWSHGSGWTVEQSATNNISVRRKTFGIDNGKNAITNFGKGANITDIARMLEKKPLFDFIFFDACFMQSVEIAYELRNCSKYVIASPTEIPGPGADYKTMIAAMFKEKNYANEMVGTYYNTYKDSHLYGSIVSAIDATRMDDFANFMKVWIANNRTALLSADYSSTLNYFDHNLYWDSGGMPDFYDLKGIALNEAIPEQARESLLEKLNSIVVDNRFCNTWFSIYPSSNRYLPVNPEQCSGVSMFIPFENKYTRRGNFSQMIYETSWGKFVWMD